MLRNYYFVLAVFVAAFTFVSCKKDKEPNYPTKDYEITQFANEPFLGETYISDYDYEAGNKFLIDRYKKSGTGACSSFRNGNFIARNLDWYIKDYAVLVVHISADKKKDRLASVGIVSSNPFVSREMIASGEVQDVVSKGTTTISNWRNIFPIFTTDGINEKGVCVSTNIVMHEDNVREGYVPCTGGSDSPEGKTSFVSLPRFILDNCKSCQDAIDKCGKLLLTQAWEGALKFEDSHIFVSDKDETVVLEWYNDHMEYTRFPRSNNFRDEHHMPAIMTNFYNYIGKKYTDDNGAIDLEKLLAEHPYAMGVERYETLRAGWEQATSFETAKNLIAKVNYSNFYNRDIKWYTENGAECGLNEGVWYYPTDLNHENYLPATNLLDAIHKMYDDGGIMDEMITEYGSLDKQMQNLDSGIESNNWYTELTSIYNIENKVLYIMPQEGWYNNKFYQFTVFGNR